MCIVIAPAVAAWASAAVAAVSTAVSYVGAKQNAESQRHVAEAQEQQREQEITQQAGNADSQAAMEARAARSQSTVAAGAAGVNLGSGSFLASLQTTTMNQSVNAGLVSENEQNQTLATVAETNSDLASRATSPTFLGGVVDTTLAAGGAYLSNRTSYNQGVNTGRGNAVSP